LEVLYNYNPQILGVLERGTKNYNPQILGVLEPLSPPGSYGPENASKSQIFSYQYEIKIENIERFRCAKNKKER